LAKNNQKCVRIDDEILKIVENVKGNGFNEKFENLVLDYRKTIPEREKYLQNLEQQIHSKLKTLADIEKRINGLKNIEFNLDNLRSSITRIDVIVRDLPVVSQNAGSCQASGNKTEIQTPRRKKCIS